MWNLYQITMAWNVKTISILKKLHFLVRALNKPDISHREEIFGVCKKFITKLIDYFFTIIDLGNASFGNESSFNQQKDHAPLIKNLVQCKSILLSILPIVVEFLNFLKKMLMKIFSVFMVMNILQANIKCAHGLMNKFGEWWRPVFLMKSRFKKSKNCFMQRMYIFSKRYKWEWWEFWYHTR